MSSLDLLVETVPNWFSIRQRAAHGFEGECLVLDDTAVSDVTYDIMIEEIGAKVYARETSVGTLLPKACYNRHIMDQGHFCLGLGYGNLVEDLDTGRLWWCSLAEFLRIQGVATSTGRWPRHIELDHGAAGRHHQLALAAAARLGCTEDYELALLGEPSWITDTGVKLTKDRSRLLNLRSPCPRGCKRRGRPVLRAECCDRAAMVALIGNERRRAVALEEFWDVVKADPHSECCGTMCACPLRDK